MLADRLYFLRSKKKMSQEEVANILGVSRQSVQKWETGLSQPSLENLVNLGEVFGCSTDYLLKDDAFLEDTGARQGAEPLPSYGHMHEWECYSKTLTTEYRQCCDEGLEIEAYKDVFSAVSKLPDGECKDKLADSLFSLVRRLSLRKDYPYFEPNGLAEINGCSDGFVCDLNKCVKEEIKDKVTGGWYGRICGCLLGKPVEGISRFELEKLLKATGNFPLSRYIDSDGVDGEFAKQLTFPVLKRLYPENYGKMPADDDTNYMLIAYEVLKRYGRNFTSASVAEVWLEMQTKNAYCTAERVAYRNFVNGYLPPDSAEYKNPYREWIGAQIRGDFFGYINPSDPQAAAAMAYRDARISHVKNGIYGEMWVAAMIAAAFGTQDIKSIIRCGLSRIPEKSRLYAAVMKIITNYEKGVSKEDCFKDIRRRWDEKDGYDWCHTVSNAEIVAASLLYGKGEYGGSVCLAVSQGFDTDCNGATVGSVLGVMCGKKNLPAVWTERICDTLESSLLGYDTVSVNGMAEKTLEFI